MNGDHDDDTDSFALKVRRTEDYKYKNNKILTQVIITWSEKVR